MEINAQLVKQLRDKTGAGMMDCKRALVENNGDINAAAEYLRKKGLMDAAKKSTRVAADGVIALAVSEDQKKAAVVEFNSETDFVAKNEKFQKLATDIASVALGKDTIEEVMQAPYPGKNHSVKDEIDSLISLVGENMNLRRMEKISVPEGVISAYIHNAVAPNLGKIGVLVALETGSTDKEKLIEFGKKVAMHTAAANPSYLCPKCVPQSLIDKEKDIIKAQAKEKGKPEAIAEKMAEGRINKLFEEIVLLEQAFVMDNKQKIKDIVESFAKDLQKPVKLSGFVKYVLGEGIEKAASNFAEEVQSFIK